uniref:Uncharacterized protein n=1 Tax=Arundo donax TaxID=35708 RepID=A0A0A9A9S0_ARUDO
MPQDVVPRPLPPRGSSREEQAAERKKSELLPGLADLELLPRRGRRWKKAKRLLLRCSI